MNYESIHDFTSQNAANGETTLDEKVNSKRITVKKIPANITPTDQEDRDLIQKIAQEQSAQAMEIFYEKFRPRIVPFLHRLTHDYPLIEEAYNEVMLKVWNNAGQYNGQSKVSTWVFTIAYRSCLRIVKRQQRYFSFFDAIPDNDNTSPETHKEQMAPDHNEHIAQEQFIQQALAKLSAKHRLVVELCYFQGYALDEISEIIGSPTNTVKTRLHHARKKLRVYLTNQTTDKKIYDFGDWL